MQWKNAESNLYWKCYFCVDCEKHIDAGEEVLELDNGEYACKACGELCEKDRLEYSH